MGLKGRRLHLEAEPDAAQTLELTFFARVAVEEVPDDGERNDVSDVLCGFEVCSRDTNNLIVLEGRASAVWGEGLGVGGYRLGVAGFQGLEFGVWGFLKVEGVRGFGYKVDLLPGLIAASIWMVRRYAPV